MCFTSPGLRIRGWLILFGLLHREVAGVLWSLTEPRPGTWSAQASMPTGGDLSCLLGRRCAPLAQYGSSEQMAAPAVGGPRALALSGLVSQASTLTAESARSLPGAEDRPEPRDWRATRHRRNMQCRSRVLARRSSPCVMPGATLLKIGPVTHVVTEERGPSGMPELGSPSVRRRRLAAELRRLREERSLTGEDVAESLGWSASKLSRIELSRTGIKPADLNRLLTEYGVPAEHRTELLRLVEKSRGRDWWRAYTDALPGKYLTLIGLESDASSIRTWSPEWVPGLLQTEDYARAAVDAHMAATASISPSEIEQRVQTRLRRQHLLTSPEPTPFVCVLDESVLLRRLQSPRVMRGQLAHLIDMSERPHISIQVLPLDGAHPIGTGAFIMLKFAPIPEIGPVADIVYVEQLSGNALYVDDAAETHQYELGFGRLVGESLDQDASRDLIARVMRARWSG